MYIFMQTETDFHILQGKTYDLNLQDRRNVVVATLKVPAGFVIT